MFDRPQARSTGLLTERVGEELVVYDSVSRGAHCLSADAAAVWVLCDGRRSDAEMAGQLGLTPARVDHALRELGDAGLLEDVSHGERRMSRRDAAKRLATVGGVALSAPLIYSVAIPRAAAAMSGSGPPDRCADTVCDDNNACTVDECDPNSGDCSFTPINCDDGNPCTTYQCDVVLGCVYTPVAYNGPCGGDGHCFDGVCIQP